jgi:RNA polymerase sigma factor (sigma-70 family)
MKTSQNPDPTEQILQQGPWVQAVAFAMVKDYQLAEDIRQDVLLDALQGSWKGVRLRRAWLAGMSKNRALNVLRSRARSQKREQRRYTPDAVQPADEIVEALENQRIILQALSSLPNSERQLIYQRFFQGKSFQRIADALDISQVTARVRLHRALGKLRARLRQSSRDWQSCCTLAMGLKEWKPVFAPSLAINPIAILSLIAAGLLVWTLLPTTETAKTNIPSTSESLEARADLRSSEGSASGTHQESKRTAIPERPSEDALNRASLSPVSWSKIPGRVVWNGVPVPQASLKFIQAGKIESFYSDGQGRFEVLMDPEFPFKVFARKEHLRGESNSINGPILIDLHDQALLPMPSLLVYNLETKKPIAGASVKISIPEIWGGRFLIAEIGHGTVLFDGVSDEEGRVPLADIATIGMTFAEVSAPGYCDYFGNYNFNWNDGYVVGLGPERSYSVQVTDLEGKGVANTKVWCGRMVKFPYLTDESGVASKIPSISKIRTRDGGVFVSCENILLELPSGRYWQAGPKGVRKQNGSSWFATADSLTLRVEDQPVRVNLESEAPSDGLVLEAARVRGAHSILPDGLGALQLEGEVGIGGGITYSWHPVPAGGSLVIQDGCAGETSWVVVRDQASKVLLGAAPVKSGQANLRMDLAPIQVSVPGLPEIGEKSWNLVLRTKWEPDIPRVDQYVFPVENDRVGGWVPQGEYEVDLSFDRDRRILFIDKNLLGSYFDGGGRFTLAKEGLVGQISIPPLQLNRVQVLVDGLPVLGGRTTGQEIDLDGTALLPCSEGLVARAKGLAPIYPGQLLAQAGGPILASDFLPTKSEPFTSVSLFPGVPLRWEIQLARIELDLQGLELDATEMVFVRALPVDIPEEEVLYWKKVRDLPFRAYSSHSPTKSPQQVTVGEGTQTLHLRVPAGRYRIRIGEAWFTSPEGTVFEPGQIYRLQPAEE